MKTWLWIILHILAFIVGWIIPSIIRCEEVVILDGKRVNKSELKNVENETPKGSRVIVYSSTGCVPCLQLEANLRAIGIKFEIVMNAPGISDTPTVIAYTDGKETGRFIGLRSVEDLKIIFGVK